MLKGVYQEIDLSTGRKIKAVFGVVGIRDNLSIHTGFDSDLDDTEFTPEEKRELAERMIVLWRRYQEQQPTA